MRVFINPGHHLGIDPGACAGGYTEAGIARDIGWLLVGYLKAVSIPTRILQSDNLCGDSPGLPCVVDDANEWPADIFVSLHLNAAENPEATGTETLIYAKGGASETLAGFIQGQLIDAIDLADRGIKERPGLAVLRHTDMPAVLVEIGFITNETDRQIILANRHKIAAAIARGITDYENAAAAAEAGDVKRTDV